MIIRIKKRDLAVVSISLILIMSVIFSLSVPLIYAVASNSTQGFGVWLVISNQNPTNITLNNVTGFSFDPVAGGFAGLIISFNVSDPDGAGDINGTRGGRVTVNITLGDNDDSQFRFSDDTCTNSTEGAPTIQIVTFNCTINMRYYDNASSKWVINITVEDSNGAIGRNSSSGDAAGTANVFTYNTVSGFSLKARHPGEGANLNFSSLNLGAQDQQAKAPLLLNNTGNGDFELIRIMAANLVGITTTTETIAASSFFVNATNNTVTAGLGAPLSASANVTIRAYEQSATDRLDNVSLLHGPSSTGDIPPYSGPTITKGNQTLVFWIDVPSSGLSAQTYNATWNMTVVDLS